MLLSMSNGLGARQEAVELPSLPVEAPTALSPDFIDDATKQRQWSAFLDRSGLEGDVALTDVAAALRRFLLPASAAAAAGEPFVGEWPSGGDWRPS